MLYYVLDLLFVLIVVGVTIALAKRSVFEVVAIWFALVLSILIALNSFEPVAYFIVTKMFAPTDEWFYCYMWFASLVAIFVFTMTLILKAFSTLLDGVLLGSEPVQFRTVERSVRWGVSAAAAYTFTAFLLTSVHAIPGTRDFGGYFPPELQNRHGPVMALGPDYQLLTFTEYVSTPRSALTGSPWRLEGPLVKASLSGNRWSSFPVRYALWREATDIKLNDRALPDDDDFEDAFDDEQYDDSQDSELDEMDPDDAGQNEAVVAYAL